MRLADRTLFPIPVTLDVSEAERDELDIQPGRRLTLRDPRDDQALAILTGMAQVTKRQCFTEITF